MPPWRSTVGDDQIPAPDGPNICVPDLFLVVGFGDSAIVYDFQITEPFTALRADTLARNVQHEYAGFSADPSSADEVGTYSTPFASVGAPVIRAAGCSSTCVFHNSAPVFALTA